MRYRIDRNANGKYRVCWREAWWPFWSTVKTYDWWGEADGVRPFASCAEAQGYIAEHEASAQAERRGNRWTKAACREESAR